jgi:dipeptide/tripeptide permease
MDEKTAIILFGFLLCVIGTVALLQANIQVAVFLLGLVIVGVASGFVKELFEMFKDIFESIFNR